MDYFIYLQWSKDPSIIRHLNNENSLKMLLSNEFISYTKVNALHEFKTASILVKANHFIFKKKELITLNDFLKILNKKFL